MAQLPEKIITTIDKITNIPSNTNLFINANGEFRQATINDIVKASSVVSDTVINAVKENIDNQFKVAQGFPLLLTDSADGNVIDFTTYGRSEQKQYSGKNELNLRNGRSATGQGVTYTKQDDGSYTRIGTATEVSGNVWFLGGYQIQPTDTNVILTLKANTSYYIKDCTLFGYDTDGTFRTVLEGIITRTLDIDITGVRNPKQTVDTVYNDIIYPIVAESTEVVEWEPFTGNAPSPSPEYPQEIVSVGDNGWFDGELLQGYYQLASGNYLSGSDYVCGKNFIPCKSGDIIKLQYEETVPSVQLLFWNDDGYITYKYESNSNVAEKTVPDNATYFSFNLNASGITPTTAKHISVTINGMYALIVKEVNKNLLRNAASSITTHGLDFTVNEDKSVTVTGTATAKTYFYYNDATSFSDGNYIFNGCPDGGSTSTYRQNVLLIDKIGTIVSTLLEQGSGLRFSTSGLKVRARIVIESGTTLNNITFYPMIRKAEVTDDTYVPHESKTTYIPLSEPLRGLPVIADGNFTDESGQMWASDEIKAIDNVCSINRKIISLIADGTNLKVVRYPTTETDLYYFNNSAIKAKIQKQGNLTEIRSSHYTTSPISTYEQPDLTCRLANNTPRIYIVDKRFSTADEFNAWLAENPVEFIVERAEELVEPFTDQTPFYNIKTFDGVTHISASDDAEMVVEYPTSRSAGIASIGWAKGNLAEIKMEQLASQMVEVQTALLNV